MPWLLFYGRRLGMDKAEIMVTRYGEMMDMVACLAVSEGRAQPKAKPRMRLEDILEMR